jgi:hypothetical protein
MKKRSHLPTAVVGTHDDLYDVAMAEVHRSLRAPTWLWQRHEQVVGEHTADLTSYIDWRWAHPDVVLGPDVDKPYDFLATFRVERHHWDRFLRAVPVDQASADLRRYIWWRVQHPALELPGNDRARQPVCAV